MKPVVSIITATFNRARFLPQMIDSVISQDYSAWELLIIDDASTDDTVQIVQSYAQTDSRIRYVRNEKNRGVSATRNRGLCEARGEYIAVLDSDDYWLDTHKLSRQVALFEQDRTLVLSGTGMCVIDEHGNTLSKKIPPADDAVIRSTLLVHNVFFHSSVMFCKAVAQKIGGYNENLRYAEDYELWLRMAKYGSVAIIPFPLVAYRVHGQSESARFRLSKSLMCMSLIWKFRRSYPHFLQAFFVGMMRSVFSLFF